MFSLLNFSTNYAIDNTVDLVKAGAYKALLRANIRSLPIKYSDVFNALKYSITQIYTFSYQNLNKSVHNPENFTDECGEYGAIYCKEPLLYKIIYNDIWPDDVKNLMFISLYACTELNLVPIEGLVPYTDDMDETVKEFAYYFLAPDPVLKECGIYSPSEISEACCIPMKNALVKSRELKVSRFKKPTLLDVCLTYNFNDFIKSYK